MATKMLAWTLALAAATAATAIPRAEEAPATEGFVSFPITYGTRSRIPVRKREVDSVQLFNISSISYLIQLHLGTPAQTVKVAIDTGSDELWVNPNCQDSRLQQDQEQECIDDGRYVPSSSSTSKRTTETNNIPYGIGEVNMTYYQDSVSLDGSNGTLKNLKFGVATNTEDLNEGILGLGWGNGKNTDYDTLVDALATQNITQTKAFSVALGSVDASNGGVIIFGGIDTKKFTGPLVSNPILGPQGREKLNRYWVQMTGMTLNYSGQTTTLTGANTPVVLDTGSSLSYLPSSIITTLSSSFGGRLDRSSGLYIVPCSQASQTGAVDFTFGGVTIKVPFKEFIWRADTNTCVMGAAASEGSGVTALLGDTFMRSAFVVFDQTNNQIAMAQYANCGEDEQAIPTAGVGNMTGSCSDSSTTGSSSGSSSGSSNNKNAAPAVLSGKTAWLAVAAAVAVQMLFVAL